MTTRMTPEALDRSCEMSASLHEKNSLPEWMYSPPTPDRPEPIEPGPNGKPPQDRSVVVECGGALYDRIVLYRLHEYRPPDITDKAGPILGGFMRLLWSPFTRDDRPSTDAKPENPARREEICELAARCAAAGTSPAIERARAWRVIDWGIRTKAAAFLDLAGWSEYAAAFRSAAPITGSALPRGTASLFRKAERETDRASSAALHGRRPYRRARRDLLDPDKVSHPLALAVYDAFPEFRRRFVRGDEVPSRQRTDLGRAVSTALYARICIDHDPRISNAEVRGVLAAVAESAHALVDELIAMGPARAAA